MQQAFSRYKSDYNTMFCIVYILLEINWKNLEFHIANNKITKHPNLSLNRMGKFIRVVVHKEKPSFTC